MKVTFLSLVWMMTTYAIIEAKNFDLPETLDNIATNKNEVCEDQKSKKYCEKNKGKCSKTSIKNKCTKTCGACPTEYGCDVEPESRIDCALTGQGGCPDFCCQDLQSYQCYERKGFGSLMALLHNLQLSVDDLKARTNNLTGIDGRLDTLEDFKDTLEDTTIPNLNNAIDTLKDTTIPDLETDIGACVLTTTYDDKIEDLETDIGVRVLTTTYDDKIEDLETDIEAVEEKVHMVASLRIYRVLSGTTYGISSVKKTFDDAQTTCQALGGHLFEPKTKAENDEVATAAAEILGSTLPWIGINDRASEGSFVYATGNQAVAFTNWVPGQPNGGNNQNCASLYTGSNSNFGKWLDNPCSNSKYFICEF